MKRTEVAIIGAGPYGLSLATHLAASGVDFRIFGQPMAFWAKIAQAAPGRYLKSFCFGTNIPAPEAGTQFAEWSRARGLETVEPCAMGDFVDYGQWLQKRCVPMLETSSVVRVSADHDGFQLLLEDGDQVAADRVVVATGLSSFEYVPSVLADLPPEAVTHSNAVRDFSSFRGRKVAVIGGGQSALEAAALLHEAGASAELIVREPNIRWMTRLPKKRTMWQRIRSPVSGLGSGPKAWVLTNMPSACHYLPDKIRMAIVRHHLPPEGAWWLRDRVETTVETAVMTGVASARVRGGQVELSLAPPDLPNQTRRFDHVIAATGFRVDVGRLSFIDEDLRQAIRQIATSPRLDHVFQSNVPGLFFLGPAAAMSFGPLFRFVIGATYAAPKLAAHLAVPLRKAG